MERYTKIRVLGKGSFGSAWLIQRNEDGAQFVAKEIRLAGLKPSERESAKHEIDMLRTLNHPNITRYIDHFEDRGSLFIVMEYANGGDLYLKIKERHGKLFSEKQILHLFAQICLALAHLHDRRILHRDLKSQNVFLTRDGVVKLGDFGISTVLRNTCELKRTVCGTPYYFSPELCLNNPYNNKSDVWALGCILYEMSTLNHAFDGNNMKALVQKILKGVYPPISSSYSPNLHKLIAAMLQMDPHNRPNVGQILELPFIRESLANLQNEVQLASKNNVSVVPAAEQQAMQREAAQRLDEHRQAEAEKAERLAELRERQQKLLEQRQKESEERRRQLLDQQRALQRQQEPLTAERKKEVDAKAREQRKAGERKQKEQTAQEKQREEQWEQNMREQREAIRQQRLREQQREAGRQQQSQDPTSKDANNRQESAAEVYKEMRRQAALNKQRMQSELGGGAGASGVPPPPPPPPRMPPSHSSSRQMSAEELEAARRDAFWEMRLEAEKNRKKLKGHSDTGAGSNGAVDGEAAATASASAAGNKDGLSPEAAASPTTPADADVDADGEDGFRAFLDAEAAKASAAEQDRQRKADYGALDMAITQALKQSTTAQKQVDFDDAEYTATNGDVTKFMLDGKALELPNVSANDPLMVRIESLRMFLEAQIGEDELLDCYHALNDISAEDDDAMREVEKLLPKSKQRFIPLVAQLIVCEEAINHQNGMGR